MAQARASEGTKPRDYQILARTMAKDEDSPVGVGYHDFGTHAGRTPEQAIEKCEKTNPILADYAEKHAVVAVPLSNWRPLTRKVKMEPKYSYEPASPADEQQRLGDEEQADGGEDDAGSE